MVTEAKSIRKGYQVTEIGEIPIEWEVRKLSDLANINRGASPRPIKDPKWFNDDSEIGWVRIADVTKSKKYLKNTVQYLSSEGVSKSRLVRPGDLIMSICGTIGRPVILDMEACIHDGFVVFNGMDTTEINKDFLIYTLNTLEDYFKNQGQPGTQVNINTSIVGKTLIALPPLKEQRKIAEILSAADEQIEQTEKLFEKAKELKKGLMQQLLTKGIAHTQFKSSEIGEIPLDWKVRSIEEIADNHKGSIKIGPFGSQLKKSSLVAEGYKVYGQENVFVNDFNIGDRFITDEKFNQLKSCELKAGDFVLTMMGTIGKCAIIPPDINKGIMDSHLLRIQLNKELYLNELLVHTIGSELVQNQIKKMSVGGIMAGLSSKVVRQIKLPVPSLSEQRKIADILSSVDNQIEIYEKEKRKQGELKKALMQQLLTGKLRVTV